MSAWWHTVAQLHSKPRNKSNRNQNEPRALYRMKGKRAMHQLCPHCQHPFPSKEIWLKSVLSCTKCEQTSCFGNFRQWLASSLIALLSMFLCLLLLPQLGYPFGLLLTIAISILMFAASVKLWVRPVPYQRLFPDNKVGSSWPDFIFEQTKCGLLQQLHWIKHFYLMHQIEIGIEVRLMRVTDDD